MQDVHKQLKLIEAGQRPEKSVRRIVAYNYEPAPTPEIQDWAENVMALNIDGS